MNILLIYEGNEEETLFKIAENNGFAKNLNVKLVNAHGAGKIAAHFQDEFSNEFYDCIYCVYDVDNRIDNPNSAYNSVRSALKSILSDDKKVDNVSICTNPNVVQFFLLGADKLVNVKLIATSKETNTALISKYWKEIGNKKQYDADKWQLEIIRDSFIYGQYKYDDLLKNAEELDLDYKNNNPASNLLPLLKALKSGDEQYFEVAIRTKNEGEKTC